MIKKALVVGHYLIVIYAFMIPKLSTVDNKAPEKSFFAISFSGRLLLSWDSWRTQTITK